MNRLDVQLQRNAQSHPRPMGTGFTAEDMVRYASVPNHPRTYVIGCLESRVSLYAQQVRALNLLWGLIETQRLQAGDPIAVVGAGFAGLTFAAGAARRRLAPTVYDAASSVLHLQAGCQKRRVHPRIYDWPRTGWNIADAGLPIMSWKAGIVADVVKELSNEWNQLGIDTRLKSRIVSINASSGGITVTTESPVAVVPYAAVILAVGYGYWKDHQSYWLDDNIEQYTPGGAVRKFRVSGLGDGAIVDTLRIRLVHRRRNNITIAVVHPVHHGTNHRNADQS